MTATVRHRSGAAAVQALEPMVTRVEAGQPDIAGGDPVEVPPAARAGGTGHARTAEACSQERRRIARDLHDVVGHALVAVSLQARAGKRRVRRDPAAAEAVLDLMDAVASRALAETRQVVDLLRGELGGRGMRPVPRLAGLEELVAGVHGEHVRVELRHVGEDGDVPASVQATAYRVVQESLSNVVRHAGPVRVVVSVRRRPGVLVVEVRDDGAGPKARSRAAGHGLLGLRERVAEVGGSVEVGSAAGGGWRVLARLPLAAQ